MIMKKSLGGMVMKLGCYSNGNYYFRYDGRYIYVYNNIFVFTTYFRPKRSIDSRLQFREICDKFYEYKLKNLFL